MRPHSLQMTTLVVELLVLMYNLHSPNRHGSGCGFTLLRSPMIPTYLSVHHRLMSCDLVGNICSGLSVRAPDCVYVLPVWRSKLLPMFRSATAPTPTVL